LCNVGLDRAHPRGAQTTPDRNLGRVACCPKSQGKEIMNVIDR
jgi:hypothetical protein